MMKTGHVEKTNDRDYEVEERYANGESGTRDEAYTFADDIELWKQPLCVYKRKRRDIWTLYEVGGLAVNW